MTGANRAAFFGVSILLTFILFSFPPKSTAQQQVSAANCSDKCMVETCVIPGGGTKKRGEYLYIGSKCVEGGRNGTCQRKGDGAQCVLVDGGEITPLDKNGNPISGPGTTSDAPLQPNGTNPDASPINPSSNSYDTGAPRTVGPGAADPLGSFNQPQGGADPYDSPEPQPSILTRLGCLFTSCEPQPEATEPTLPKAPDGIVGGGGVGGILPQSSPTPDPDATAGYGSFYNPEGTFGSQPGPLPEADKPWYERTWDWFAGGGTTGDSGPVITDTGDSVGTSINPDGSVTTQDFSQPLTEPPNQPIGTNPDGSPIYADPRSYDTGASTRQRVNDLAGPVKSTGEAFKESSTNLETFMKENNIQTRTPTSAISGDPNSRPQTQIVAPRDPEKARELQRLLDDVQDTYADYDDALKEYNARPLSERMTNSAQVRAQEAEDRLAQAQADYAQMYKDHNERPFIERYFSSPGVDGQKGELERAMARERGIIVEADAYAHALKTSPDPETLAREITTIPHTDYDAARQEMLRREIISNYLANQTEAELQQRLALGPSDPLLLDVAKIRAEDTARFADRINQLTYQTPMSPEMSKLLDNMANPETRSWTENVSSWLNKQYQEGLKIAADPSNPDFIAGDVRAFLAGSAKGLFVDSTARVANNLFGFDTLTIEQQQNRLLQTPGQNMFDAALDYTMVGANGALVVRPLMRGISAGVESITGTFAEIRALQGIGTELGLAGDFRYLATDALVVRTGVADGLMAAEAQALGSSLARVEAQMLEATTLAELREMQATRAGILQEMRGAGVALDGAGDIVALENNAVRFAVRDAAGGYAAEGSIAAEEALAARNVTPASRPFLTNAIVSEEGFNTVVRNVASFPLAVAEVPFRASAGLLEGLASGAGRLGQTVGNFFRAEGFISNAARTLGSASEFGLYRAASAMRAPTQVTGALASRATSAMERILPSREVGRIAGSELTSQVQGYRPATALTAEQRIAAVENRIKGLEATGRKLDSEYSRIGDMRGTSGLARETALEETQAARVANARALSEARAELDALERPLAAERGMSLAEMRSVRAMDAARSTEAVAAAERQLQESGLVHRGQDIVRSSTGERIAVRDQFGNYIDANTAQGRAVVAAREQGELALQGGSGGTVPESITAREARLTEIGQQLELFQPAAAPTVAETVQSSGLIGRLGQFARESTIGQGLQISGTTLSVLSVESASVAAGELVSLGFRTGVQALEGAGLLGARSLPGTTLREVQTLSTTQVLARYPAINSPLNAGFGLAAARDGIGLTSELSETAGTRLTNPYVSIDGNQIWINQPVTSGFDVNPQSFALSPAIASGPVAINFADASALIPGIVVTGGVALTPGGATAEPSVNLGTLPSTGPTLARPSPAPSPTAVLTAPSVPNGIGRVVGELKAVSGPTGNTFESIAYTACNGSLTACSSFKTDGVAASIPSGRDLTTGIFTPSAADAAARQAVEAGRGMNDFSYLFVSHNHPAQTITNAFVREFGEQIRNVITNPDAALSGPSSLADSRPTLSIGSEQVSGPMIVPVLVEPGGIWVSANRPDFDLRNAKQVEYNNTRRDLLLASQTGDPVQLQQAIENLKETASRTMGMEIEFLPHDATEAQIAEAGRKILAQSGNPVINPAPTRGPLAANPFEALPRLWEGAKSALAYVRDSIITPAASQPAQEIVVNEVRSKTKTSTKLAPNTAPASPPTSQPFVAPPLEELQTKLTVTEQRIEAVTDEIRQLMDLRTWERVIKNRAEYSKWKTHTYALINEQETLKRDYNMMAQEYNRIAIEVQRPNSNYDVFGEKYSVPFLGFAAGKLQLEAASWASFQQEVIRADTFDAIEAALHKSGFRGIEIDLILGDKNPDSLRDVKTGLIKQAKIDIAEKLAALQSIRKGIEQTKPTEEQISTYANTGFISLQASKWSTTVRSLYPEMTASIPTQVSPMRNLASMTERERMDLALEIGRQFNDEWRARLSANGRIYDDLRVVVTTAPTKLWGNSLPSDAFYHGGSVFVNVNADFLINAQIEGTETALWSTIAHEFGHGIQHQLGLQDSYGSRWQERGILGSFSVFYETQADFLAGTLCNVGTWCQDSTAAFQKSIGTDALRAAARNSDKVPLYAESHPYAIQRVEAFNLGKETQNWQAGVEMMAARGVNIDRDLYSPSIESRPSYVTSSQIAPDGFSDTVLRKAVEATTREALAIIGQETAQLPDDVVDSDVSFDIAEGETGGAQIGDLGEIRYAGGPEENVALASPTSDSATPIASPWPVQPGRGAESKRGETNINLNGIKATPPNQSQPNGNWVYQNLQDLINNTSCSDKLHTCFISPEANVTAVGRKLNEQPEYSKANTVISIIAGNPSVVNGKEKFPGNWVGNDERERAAAGYGRIGNWESNAVRHAKATAVGMAKLLGDPNFNERTQFDKTDPRYVAAFTIAEAYEEYGSLKAKAAFPFTREQIYRGLAAVPAIGPQKALAWYYGNSIPSSQQEIALSKSDPQSSVSKPAVSTKIAKAVRDALKPKPLTTAQRTPDLTKWLRSTDPQVAAITKAILEGRTGVSIDDAGWLVVPDQVREALLKMGIEFRKEEWVGRPYAGKSREDLGKTTTYLVQHEFRNNPSYKDLDGTINSHKNAKGFRRGIYVDVYVSEPVETLSNGMKGVLAKQIKPFGEYSSHAGGDLDNSAIGIEHAKDAKDVFDAQGFLADMVLTDAIKAKYPNIQIVAHGPTAPVEVNRDEGVAIADFLNTREKRLSVPNPASDLVKFAAAVNAAPQTGSVARLPTEPQASETSNGVVQKWQERVRKIVAGDSETASQTGAPTDAESKLSAEEKVQLQRVVEGYTARGTRAGGAANKAEMVGLSFENQSKLVGKQVLTNVRASFYGSKSGMTASGIQFPVNEFGISIGANYRLAESVRFGSKVLVQDTAGRYPPVVATVVERFASWDTNARSKNIQVELSNAFLNVYPNLRRDGFMDPSKGTGINITVLNNPPNAVASVYPAPISYAGTGPVSREVAAALTGRPTGAPTKVATEKIRESPAVKVVKETPAVKKVVETAGKAKEVAKEATEKASESLKSRSILASVEATRDASQRMQTTSGRIALTEAEMREVARNVIAKMGGPEALTRYYTYHADGSVRDLATGRVLEGFKMQPVGSAVESKRLASGFNKVAGNLVALNEMLRALLGQDELPFNSGARPTSIGSNRHHSIVTGPSGSKILVSYALDYAAGKPNVKAAFAAAANRGQWALNQEIAAITRKADTVKLSVGARYANEPNMAHIDVFPTPIARTYGSKNTNALLNSVLSVFSRKPAIDAQRGPQYISQAQFETALKVANLGAVPAPPKNVASVPPTETLETSPQTESPRGPVRRAITNLANKGIEKFRQLAAQYRTPPQTPGELPAVNPRIAESAQQQPTAPELPNVNPRIAESTQPPVTEPPAAEVPFVRAGTPNITQPPPASDAPLTNFQKLLAWREASRIAWNEKIVPKLIVKPEPIVDSGTVPYDATKPEALNPPTRAAAAEEFAGSPLPSGTRQPLAYDPITNAPIYESPSSFDTGAPTYVAPAPTAPAPKTPAVAKPATAATPNPTAKPSADVKKLRGTADSIESSRKAMLGAKARVGRAEDRQSAATAANRGLASVDRLIANANSVVQNRALSETERAPLTKEIGILRDARDDLAGAIKAENQGSAERTVDRISASAKRFVSRTKDVAAAVQARQAPAPIVSKIRGLAVGTPSPFAMAPTGYQLNPVVYSSAFDSGVPTFDAYLGENNPFIRVAEGINLDKEIATTLQREERVRFDLMRTYGVDSIAALPTPTYPESRYGLMQRTVYHEAVKKRLGLEVQRSQMLVDELATMPSIDTDEALKVRHAALSKKLADQSAELAAEEARRETEMSVYRTAYINSLKLSPQRLETLTKDNAAALTRLVELSAPEIGDWRKVDLTRDDIPLLVKTEIATQLYNQDLLDRSKLPADNAKRIALFTENATQPVVADAGAAKPGEVTTPGATTPTPARAGSPITSERLRDAIQDPFVQGVGGVAGGAGVAGFAIWKYGLAAIWSTVKNVPSKIASGVQQAARAVSATFARTPVQPAPTPTPTTPARAPAATPSTPAPTPARTPSAPSVPSVPAPGTTAPVPSRTAALGSTLYRGARTAAGGVAGAASRTASRGTQQLRNWWQSRGSGGSGGTQLELPLEGGRMNTANTKSAIRRSLERFCWKTNLRFAVCSASVIGTVVAINQYGDPIYDRFTGQNKNPATPGTTPGAPAPGTTPAPETTQPPGKQSPGQQPPDSGGGGRGNGAGGGGGRNVGGGGGGSGGVGDFLKGLMGPLAQLLPSLMNYLFGPQEPEQPTLPDPRVALDANPGTVASSTTSKLSWSGKDISNCTVYGPGSARLTSGGASGSTSTPSLSRSTEFGVVCAGTNGTEVSAKTIVRVRGDTQDLIRVQLPMYGVMTGGSSSSQNGSGQSVSGQSQTDTANGEPAGSSVTPPTTGVSPTGQTTSPYCEPSQPIESFIDCLCRLEPTGCKPYRQ